MKFFAPLALVFASSVLAQRITTTLPYADGDTLVVSVQTNANGLPTATVTLQTLTNGVANTNTATTTARTTATATTATTARTTTARTTTERVVGQETSYEPVKTYTYGYDDGSGDWVTATWTATVTAAPDVATAIVPEGSILDYEAYQSSVNKQVFASAQNAENAIVSSKGAAGKRAAGPSGVVLGMVIGVVGAGVGVFGL